MLNLRVLHIGDLHLGRDFSIKSSADEDFSLRREELWKSFENSLEYALLNGVEIVLISGDLYENETMSLSNLDRLAYLFEKFYQLKFFISLGNHDHISGKSEYLKSIISENVYIFENLLDYVEVKKNIRIYGFSWSKVEYDTFELEKIYLDEEYLNILLIHGMNSSNNKYLPLNVLELENWGFDYIALGHIHKPGKIGEKTFYSGSLEPLSFNDLGQRGGYLVDFIGKEFQSKFVNFATREYKIIEYDLSNVTSNPELYKNVNDLLDGISERNYLRLELTGSNNNLDISQLQTMLSHRFYYFEILDFTSEFIDLELIISSNKDNLLGKYLEYVKENYSGRDREKLIEIAIKVFPWREEFEN